MERTPINIDDIIRKRVQDAAPPPPAFVWDNVERELRKRRRRAFFWIFTLGIIGTGMLGLWIANADQREQLTSAELQATEKMQQVHSAGATGGQPAPGGLNTNTSEKNNGDIAADEPLQRSLTTPKGMSSHGPAGISVAPLPNRTINEKADLTPVTIEETTPATQEAAPQKTFFEGIKTIENLSFPIQALPRPGIMMPVKSQHLMADLVHKSWPNALTPALVKPKAKKPIKNCYDFAKQPNAWLIDAYFGPSLAQRELIASPDDRPYLNKRLNTEHRNLTYNAGLRASLMLKGNFLLRTGVHYDQITEVFEYADPQYVVYHVNIIVNHNGTTTYDTVGIDYGEKYQKTFNRLGMLDIPLTAGIEMRKGRSGFNINAGMSLNVLFWKRGAILSPDSGDPTWFTPGKAGAEEVFRPHTGINATASLQWFYHVKPRLRVFVEPSFKKVLRPVSLNSHPVEQRYSIAGLRLGLTKILN